MSWNLRRFDALMPWLAGTVVFLLSLQSPQSPQAAGFTPECWPDCDTYTHIASPWVVVLAAMSGIAAGLGQRLRWPLYVTAALGWLVFSMWPAAAAASYYTGLKEKRKRPPIYLAVTVALVVGMILVETARKSLPQDGPLLLAAEMIGFVVLLPFVVGLWLRTRREEQLILQDLRAEQARELERGRIAREMHDVVAHRVSLMVLHAGALELGATDERTARTAGLIRSAGREAMTELRQALGVLREPAGTEPQPTVADIPELVERTRSAGVPVTLDIELESIPATVSRTAFRVVQEGLTNVVKHAGPVPTEVTVAQGNDDLHVIVHNGPKVGRHDQLPGSGFGLIGLRERVGLLGGALETERPPGGGFTLRVWLPLKPSERAELEAE